MNGGWAIAIDLPGTGAGPRRLRALAAGKGRRRGSIKVQRVLSEEVPSDVDPADAELIGKWIGGRLRAAGFPRGKAIFALRREHVVVKRLTFPTIESAELPDMTHLAMHRDLPIQSDEAVIDFVPVENGGTNTTILAVAVARSLVDYVQAVAKAAGLGVERITLRTMGAAALAAGARALEIESAGSERDSQSSETAASEGDSVLAIDIAGESIEFCAVAGGAIHFSRAAEVPPPQDQLAIADAVVTETRRTWISCQTTISPRSCVVMGERRVSEYAAEPVGQMLNVPVHVLEAHPLVEGTTEEIGSLWPLAGLLLESNARGEMIDLAHPRKAPDLGARARQRRLLAAGVIIIAALGLWTFARLQLKSLDEQAFSLAAAVKEQAPANARYARDQYKLEHLKRWESTNVDWLQHASYLTTIAANSGGPNRLVLDSLTGDLKSEGVKYDSKVRKWSADQQVTIVVDGEARDRETADSFRAALVQSAIYATATPGADARGGKRMPFGFTYRLRTKESAPAQENPQTASSGEGGSP